MREKVTLVRFASGIGEEEARTTQRTKVVEHVESIEQPADAKITPQLPSDKFMMFNTTLPRKNKDSSWLSHLISVDVRASLCMRV